MSKKLKVDETSVSSVAVNEIADEANLVHKSCNQTPSTLPAATPLEEYAKNLTATSFLPITGKSYLTEADVGITEFVEPSPESFLGIIKQRSDALSEVINVLRYSDFLVNEVDHTGKILRLEERHQPTVENEESAQADSQIDIDQKLEELRAIIDDDALIEKIKPVLSSRTRFAPIVSEVARFTANAHTSQIIEDKDKRAQVHRFFKTSFKDFVETEALQDKKIRIKFADKSKKRNLSKQEFDALGGQYAEFILYKENLETMAAINQLAKTMRVPFKAFTFAGTKDKRGITVQKITGHRIDLEKFNSIGDNIKGVAIGKVRYTENRIKLGDLSGNHFTIALREVKVKDNSASQLEHIIEKRMKSLEENGFINYYGMQRFGTRAVSTHVVGIAMLASRWDVAVELILMPKGDAERAVLQSLIQQKKKRDYFQALQCIPRNLRLMYIHAVQSYIWNYMASERFRRYGATVTVGDLVVVKTKESDAVAIDNEERKGEEDDEFSLEDSRLARLIEVETVQTEEDAKTRSIEDVVLPLPGYQVEYPKNDIGKCYEDFMQSIGLDPHNMKRKTRNLLKYESSTDPLCLSDMDRLNGKTEPQAALQGSKVGLVCEFTLETSSYATMALREVLRADTSSGFQTELTDAARNPSTADEEVGDADLFGMSDRNVVDFIIASARSAKSDSKLLNTLQGAADLPQTDRARQFVSDLYRRIPRPKASAAKEDERRRKAEARERAALIKKSADFALIQDDDEHLKAQEELLARASKKEKKDKKDKSKSLRKKDENEGDDGEEGNQVVRRKRKRQSDDAEEDEESKIQHDKEEVEELNRKLREKDLEKKRLKEEKFSQGNEEARLRKKIAEDAELRAKAIPDLRLVSREKYLEKREDVKLMLLEREIEDEEFLFSGEKLSKREQKELEYKKTALKLAKERMKINDKPDGYTMPEDYITEKGKLDKKKQEAVLYKRYIENEDPDQFVSEQSVWEDYQIRNATISKAKAQAEPENEFDYVYEDPEQLLDRFVSVGAPELEDTDEPPPVQLSDAERKAMTIKEVRESLPIYEFRQQLLDAVENFQVIIIVGETGSGKTTQIPQYLHEAGYTKNGKKVGCTQPRRVAAMSVATRVAEEMGTKVGAEVGYSIRFEDCTSDKTVVKFMTDGMLLREFLTEPDLASYSCLMIDEAHERTLHTDILFGLLKDIARYRKDLRLLISSATMNAFKFNQYFDDAPIFTIKGRKFPVTVYHTQAPEADYLKAAIKTIMTIHISEPKGDILLFLTGQEEIEDAEATLQLMVKQLGSKIPEMKICPIYAALPSDKQAEIFEPTPEGVRKVVLATNIAETSITIDGIVYVIDPGFCKQKSYNPKTGMESLIVVPASRAAADQRKGRAGRVQPGKCFRLYTAWAYQNELEEDTVPEIQRTNLASVVLMLKSLGIDNLMNFDFMDAPPAETLMKAIEQLYALGALNSRGDLTKLGRRMAEFPMDPMLSKALIASETYQCSEEYVETNFSIAWCRENYIQHRTMKRARDIREQLIGLMERTEVPLISNPDPGNTVPIRKALTSGFFYNTARLQRSGDTYRTIKHNETVTIHPSSSLYISKSNANSAKQYPKWVLYFELVFTTREFMRQVIEIQSDWLLEGQQDLADHNDFYPAHLFRTMSSELMGHLVSQHSSKTVFVLHDGNRTRYSTGVRDLAGLMLALAATNDRVLKGLKRFFYINADPVPNRGLRTNHMDGVRKHLPGYSPLQSLGKLCGSVPTLADTIRLLVVNGLKNGQPVAPLLKFNNRFRLIKDISLVRLAIFNAEISIHLQPLLMNCFSLERLDLTNCLWIKDSHLLSLISCMRLQKLILRGCGNLKGECLGLLLENLENLDTLDLSSCDRITELVPVFANCRAPLKVVDLTSTLGAADLNQALAALFRQCFQTLESLTLQGPLLDLPAFTGLSALPAPLRLRHLRLSSCQNFTNEHLRLLRPHLNHIETLQLIGSSQLTAPALMLAFERTPHLQHLDVSYVSGFTDEAVAYLARACPRLGALLSRGCSLLTDRALHALAALLPSTALRTLYLDFNDKVTPRGLAALLHHARAVDDISLSFCGRFFDTDVERLARRGAVMGREGIPTGGGEFMQFAGERNVRLLRECLERMVGMVPLEAFDVAEEVAQPPDSQ
ncbi:hypothetical protein HDU96_007328 [Phlyctochytrium bullatum]|nr:hypothetical protein HDU96_007328 [Phlyctochytrium bullatum]